MFLFPETTPESNIESYKMLLAFQKMQKDVRNTACNNIMIILFQGDLHPTFLCLHPKVFHLYLTVSPV